MSERQLSKSFPHVAMGAINDCSGTHGVHSWEAARQRLPGEDNHQLVLLGQCRVRTDLWDVCFLSENYQFLYKICFG